MSLLKKLRQPQARNKRISKKKIRQGYIALLWMHRQQMYLGWTGWQKKQFWHDFIRSPASRASTITKGMEMVGLGKTPKKEK